MNYDKYILIDYENIHSINFDIIDKNTKVLIIVGENQNELPADLIQKAQPFGNSIEWLQFKRDGKKTLSKFFIVYFLGYYISGQGSKEFKICSNDKDYDPIIEYLKDKNINVERTVSFKLINKDNKNRFIKKLSCPVLMLWKKWTVIQKVSFAVIAIAFIGGIMTLLPSRQAMAPVISAPIRDEAACARIVSRINQEGIKTSVTPDGLVRVIDENTARRVRAILIREDLIPAGTDPWDIFNRERWTVVDFDRNIYFRRDQTQMLTGLIRAIDDVDDAIVTMVWPERKLFESDRDPVTVSVIITPKPESDITGNRKKIEGIQKILKPAVDGLTDENIVITDQFGLILNNFDFSAEKE
jgi:hypothetical protein